MKLHIVTIIVLGILLGGCVEEHWDVSPYTTDVKAQFNAPHSLRKMFCQEKSITTKTPAEAKLSGGFFLFLGEISGHYKEGSTQTTIVSQVKFAWNVGNNTYAPLTIPLEKARIHIDDSAKIPTVAFFLNDLAINDALYHFIRTDKDKETVRWAIEHSSFGLLKNAGDFPQFLIENPQYLKYVVISVGSKDWPANINMPMDKN